MHDSRRERERKKTTELFNLKTGALALPALSALIPRPGKFIHCDVFKEEPRVPPRFRGAGRQMSTLHWRREGESRW
uniref:Uncharacterized protein n=1 Tax=Knipowitschia caucasica TaxID=637954 RepID=A0AAV2KUE4_KNICA